ncbi:MAG: membrane protein insertase YidC [Sphingomonas sp.]|uniref:membrane protein insertase YidC n=1 Tax=Sphingomonas sp. TaxID=28214 RepID=UPI001220074C|nr:membrane protein insertase YidC [Sphingomonas sp.]THD35256.1 MAG: membrane protein insertase YidC [Sphingomonas sp.]
MSNDNRNFITFAVIAALILFGWPVIAGRLFPPANPPVTRIEGGKTKVVPNTTAPSPSTPAKTRDLKAVLGESAGQRVAIDTPTLKGSINLRGARIDDLVLSDYKETIAKNSPAIRLLSPVGTADAYYAQFGWQDNGLKPPSTDTVWQASGDLLAPGKPVTLTAANGQGQVFGIELSVDDQYMFTIRQTVVNKSGAPVSVATTGLIGRAQQSKDLDSWTIQIGPMSVHDKKADYNLNWKDVAASKPFTTNGGWLGFTDKYWLTALVPDQASSFAGQFTAPTGQGYAADYARAATSLAPGKALTQTSRFFAGAKEVRMIDHYSDNHFAPMLDYAIDWGWFRIIEKPIFYYLDWLFRMVGNFGVAIMLLTVTIRGLIFPIAQRQFASMASMRAIQPKMKALQERYKDDKQRQQQEIMKLYKTEKVNPLAGCLPTLIQIPIMYSLYKVLMLTIEMRHQPFVAWIKDLSAPDPLTPINLFGLLDFVPPHWIAIGVVPILLGISMWLQFRMNPAPMDEAQKQVFALMPWVLMFVMAPFAVGLQVYWITSNLLTVLQQKVLYARHPALKQPVVK